MRPRRGLGWQAIQWATRSPYAHCGVALWLEQGLWMAEMDGAKNVLVPLSQYSPTPFDAFACPVDRGRVREDILVTLRGKIQYDWADILRLGLHHLTGLELPGKDDGRLVCSSYAAAIYLRTGWQPARALPVLCTPADVVDRLDRGPVASNDP